MPSFADLFDAGEREALLLPTRFNPEIIRTPGSDVNIVLAVSAAMAEEGARFYQVSFNELHLATARGEALDRWLNDRYGLPREGAKFAKAELRLTRTATTPGIAVPEGSLFGTDDGVVFATEIDAAFPDGSTGPILVDAVAQVTGDAGNVDAGEITEVIGPLEDTTVLVTNVEDAAGGLDAEDDDTYRQRGRDFFRTARRGTRSAIRFGATETDGVSLATVIEVLDPDGVPAFRVQLTIADENGRANAALVNAVNIALDEFRALGVPVTTRAGSPEFVDITITGVLFESGVNTVAKINDAKDKIVAAVNALEPDETLRSKTVILGAMARVTQISVPEGAVTEPAGDVVPGAGGVLRTTKERITINGV